MKEKPVFSKVKEFYEKHFESFREVLTGKKKPVPIPVETNDSPAQEKKKKMRKFFIERN